MRLPFQRNRERDPRAAPDRGALGGEAPLDALAAARLSARRRLIGAVILLAIGVAGFPLLFETAPRPLSADLPIVTAHNEVPRAPAARPAPAVEPSAAVRPAAEATAPTRAEAASAASGTAAASTAPAPTAAPATREAGASTAAAAKPPVPGASSAATASARPGASAAPTVPAPPAKASAPARIAASAAAPVAPRAANTAASSAPAAARAQAAPSPAPTPATPAASEGRFVIQVGAYSDAGTLRDTRHKVEKLGLRTYTQVIEGDAGRRTRVRVGPFATRAEAQAAAAKLKAAGLPANLLTL